MDSKQFIQEYENLFDWEKREVKKYINGNFNIKNRIELIFDKFDDLEYDIDTLHDEIRELKKVIKTL